MTDNVNRGRGLTVQKELDETDDEALARTFMDPVVRRNTHA